MSDLAGFLTARIAEDDANTDWHTAVCGYDQAEFVSECVCRGPARVRMECAAKRRIVAAHPLTDQCVFYGKKRDRPDLFFGCVTCHDWDGLTEPKGYCDTLKALASVYADHADFRPEWR